MGTVHAKLPADAAALALTVVQLVPLLVEYSIFTLVILVNVHVIFWAEPAIHDSPPLGATTVMPGGGAMVKTALLTSFVAAFDASLMRTRACEVGVLGTVHEKLPADAAVLALTVVQPLPLLEEYSILTFVIVVNVHVMFWVVNAVHDSPPLGEVTVTLGGDAMVKTALLVSMRAELDASLIRTRA